MDCIKINICIRPYDMSLPTYTLYVRSSDSMLDIMDKMKRNYNTYLSQNSRFVCNGLLLCVNNPINTYSKKIKQNSYIFVFQ